MVLAILLRIYMYFLGYIDILHLYLYIQLLAKNLNLLKYVIIVKHVYPALSVTSLILCTTTRLLAITLHRKSVLTAKGTRSKSPNQCSQTMLDI